MSNIIQDHIDIANNGKDKTLTGPFYTKSKTDNKYLYLLDENSNKLYIYDLKTLERVKTITFLMKPTSMDVCDGKLVIGFGDCYQFRIYDTTTFDYEIVTTSVPPYSTVVYQNEIIYATMEEKCEIYRYNINDKTHTLVNHVGNSVSLDIDRNAGIIYLGDLNSSPTSLSYYNIETNKVIKVFESRSNIEPVYFDGNFVHYYGKILDKSTGKIISNSEIARQYPNLNKMLIEKTIFDDGSISIYTGMKNGKFISVVYDLQSNIQLYKYEGNTTNAYRFNNTIVLFNNESNVVKTFTID